MHKARPAIFILLVVLALACQGCAFLEYHTFSAPVLGTERRSANANGVTMQFDGIVVAIKSENEDYLFDLVGPYPVPIIPLWRSPKYSAPLKIQVTLSAQGQPELHQGTEKGNTGPDENIPGGNKISFRPMQVRLESNGTVLRPDGFYHYSCAHQKGVVQIKGEVHTQENAVEFFGSSCFSIEFPRSSSPEEPFVLQMAGVMLDGRPVEIPSFQFQKGSTWLLFAVP